MRSDAQALVSVIVPIFNVEKYLEQCLQSILSQTHEKLEVICINDGSTDGSLAIIQQYAASDSRIRVVDKHNEGYGASCNLGISLARGAWVSIIEPDDWIDATMYAEMLALAASFEERIDMVKTPWLDVRDWDDPATQREQPSLLTHRLRTSKRPFMVADAPILLELHPAIWSAIYRRDFIEEHGIRFMPIPGAGWADNPFLIETLCQAKNIVYLDKPFYHYRADLPGSTINHASDDAVERPFVRWLDMNEVLKRLEIADRSILEAHAVRAFTYVFGAIHDDGWDNPLVQRRAREVFASIEPELVLNARDIAPERKRFFFEVLGEPAPRIPMTPWLRRLVGEAWWTLRTEGLTTTLGRFAKMIGSKRS